jgi:site-specific DNA-cytosine methylase
MLAKKLVENVEIAKYIILENVQKMLEKYTKTTKKCIKRFLIKNNYYTETTSVNISQKYKIKIPKNIGK